jgi:DNA-binding NarL/FixJ family response regulator
MNEYQVLIIDDNALFLSTMDCYFRLTAQDTSTPVRTFLAATWADAVDILMEHKIDVVLIDYYLGTQETALAHIPCLKRTFQIRHVVVMTGKANFEEGADAIISGASMCLVKDNMISMTQKILKILNGPQPKTMDLTPKEREVAKLLCEGLSNKTIAKILNVSIYTVNTHLRNLYTKLKISTRAELIRTIRDML